MVHAHAVLTPRGRLMLARLAVDEGWPIVRAAEHFNVSWPTVKRWVLRYVEIYAAGMEDRSSRPHHSPNRTSQVLVRKVVHLRWRHRLSPLAIASRLSMPASTFHAVLVRCRLNRLSHIDIRTGENIGRYEHDRPGSLIHVDVKSSATFLRDAAGASSDASRAARTAKLRRGPPAAATAVSSSGTPSSTPLSTTTPGWLTPRSTTMKPSPLRSQRCVVPWAGSHHQESPSSGCYLTTARATAPTPGVQLVQICTSSTKELGSTALKPTARLNASTALWLPSGLSLAIPP